MARRTQRPPTAGANHLEWLRLVEVSGPFLSLPVLKEALPQGLEADDRDVRAELKAAHAEWNAHNDDRAYHSQWIRFVLARALEYGPEVLVDGQGIPAKLRVRAALHNETLQPDFAVLGMAAEGERPALIVIAVHEPGTDLERALEGAKWKASPLTRMVELLRGSSDSDLSLGLVTNGEQWVLVSAPRKGTSTFVTWHASLWFEEKITLQSFRTLLGVRRTLGAVDDTLERLIERSAEHQHDVTIQLGLQVREAIELLVRRIDELDRRANRTVLAGVSEKQVYEAAVTVMMRLVFVFYLEEQADLYFPVAKSTFYQRHYALSPLGATLRAEADRLGPDVLERRSSAWCRLLAAFRAIHGGVIHEDMRLPAYGGHLFDPDRFPFLEGRKPGESWRIVQASPLGVDDATVLFVLEALQVLRVRDTGTNGAETRRLSFRELGVEQIGNVYESLLDHTAKRAVDAVVSLKGVKGEEPEVELHELEQRYAAGDPTKLVSFVKEKTGRSEPAITKDLEYEIEDDSARWLVACGNDRELYGRVKPIAGLVREDRRQLPVVYAKDSVYVTAGADRRSTGTHYTPPSLTEPIVKHTLEPLVYEGPAKGLRQEEWKLRTSRAILDLKVCDLACGSGAFLVQACRYLSDRLVEAWQVLEDANPGRLLVSPTGDLSEGRTDERVIARDTSERTAIARRAVVDRCLYGVDVNSAAVEMAKLSLWLITLQRDRPFTFLDHALKCGDSLLGVSSVKQVENFSLRPGERQATFANANLSRHVEEASTKRRTLEDLSSNDHAQIESKHLLHSEAEAATARVKVIADALIALELLGLDGDQYEQRRADAADRADLAMMRSIPESYAHIGEQLGNSRGFHWPLEFPEVFGGGGFDAFVGNPPFMGAKRITGSVGTAYRNYLVRHTARQKSGNADLCAYFVLRAAALLRDSGCLGLIVTNSIAQGDTRAVGLDQLVTDTFPVHRAIASRAWPGSASVEVALLWMHKARWNATSLLDDQPVVGISSSLTAAENAGRPQLLKRNSGLCFQGSNILGTGFMLGREEAQRLIAKDARNRDVLFPYLNGEELNASPDQSGARWIVNFCDWPLDRESAGAEYSGPLASDYGDCLQLIRDRVKPERDALGLKSDASAKGYARLWWQYARKAIALYIGIRGVGRVLAMARTSNTQSPAFVQNGMVYSDALVVFAMSGSESFAVLASSLHVEWVLRHRGTMRTDTVYKPADCFETFPFPARSQDRLATVGETYHEYRRQLMITRQEGLTKTYNRVHTPGERSEDIARLRVLRVELDQAVADAYGWSDLSLGHDFHEGKLGVRYTINEPARRAILDRLLSLNHRRYQEEVEAGLHEKASSTKHRKDRTTTRSAAAPQRDLAFGVESPSREAPKHDE